MGAFKSANAGSFVIPTQPAAFVTVTSGVGAFTYGSYIQMIASTAAPIFITHVVLNPPSGQYIALKIGTGPATETDVGEYIFASDGSAKPDRIELDPWIAVATATRIAAKTADEAGSKAHKIALECVNQANVLDAGLFQQVDVERWVGTAPVIPNTLGVPVVDTRQIVRTGTAAGGGASSITLDAGASATNDFYRNMGIYIISGTGAGQFRIISSYIGAAKLAVIAPNWMTNPDATSVFQIVPASVALQQVWDDSPDFHRTTGTFGALFAGKPDLAFEADAIHSHIDTLASVFGAGTLQAATGTTATLAVNDSPVDDAHLGKVLYIVTGTGAGQGTLITGYAGATRVATVMTWRGTTPDATSKYVVI